MPNAEPLPERGFKSIAGVSGRDAAASSEVSPPTLDLSIYRRVSEVWFVVRDLERTVSYWETLGVNGIQHLGKQVASGMRYPGQESDLTVKTASAGIGDVRIVWLEPVSGVSIFDDFLERRGDGVHHLTFAVKNAGELEREVRRFKSSSVGVLMEGYWKSEQGERQFSYIDTAERGGGIMFELACDPHLTELEASQNEPPFNRITQYALVARDLKRVAAFYEELGFGSMPLIYVSNLDREYRGTPGNFEIYVGNWRWGRVTFEWIQPVIGPSVFEEFLAKQGEGLHHFAFEVQDLDQAVLKMEEKGLKVAQSGRFDYPTNKGRFAYMDTEPGSGVMVEFNWHEPAYRR
jgi:catechol 2,3-dioxygenase-like lactoylglutathione lyase family enzyme